MKLAKLLVLAGVLVGMPGFWFSGASALDAMPTGEDYWLKDTALKISAYARTGNGTDLQYLELFNDSDGLLRIEDWKITGVFGSVRADLPIITQAVGKIKPRSHAVVQVAAEVGHASFDSSTWDPVPTTNILLSSLEVSSLESGWKTDVYTLKTTGSGSTTKFDDFWTRTQISGESYTSTLSSFNVTNLSLHDDGLYDTPLDFHGKIVEVYSYASDCSPDDKSVLCGDYVKIKLDTTNTELDSYVLRTDSSSSSRTSSNTFYLGDYTPTADGYVTVNLDENGKRINLTNSGGYVWVEDLYEGIIYRNTMTQYASAGGHEQGFAWARGDESSTWQWTTTPRPGADNLITLPVEAAATCPAGKYLNPDTGRCRTIEEAVNALAACPEGQERNPATNRCRAKVLAASTSLVPCGEGQERNPATNRCRSIASAVAELMPCDEGYERNPATNRCRKVAGAMTTAPAGATTVIEAAKGSTWDAWTWALISIGAAGAISYGVYEWRDELLGVGKKIVARLGKK